MWEIHSVKNLSEGKGEVYYEKTDIRKKLRKRKGVIDCS